MVHPLTPFAMRGAIWYQGESNGNEGESYYQKHALVNGWREAFQNPNLAFYWTQLCSWDHGNLLKKEILRSMHGPETGDLSGKLSSKHWTFPVAEWQ